MIGFSGGVGRAGAQETGLAVSFGFDLVVGPAAGLELVGPVVQDGFDEGGVGEGSGHVEGMGPPPMRWHASSAWV